jgi:small GTP-binding protein
MKNAIIVGQAASGKTAIKDKIISNIFSEQYSPTIGVDETICFDDKLSLVDPSGQVHYDKFVDTYYRNQHLILLILDSHSDKKSLDYLTKKKKLIDKANACPPAYILVINKIDLIPSITSQEMKDLLKKIKPIAVVNCSAKNGKGINELKLLLSKEINCDGQVASCTMDKFVV